MANSSLSEYEKHHSGLPNEDLVRIAYFEASNIKKEARKSAKKILADRRLSVNQLEKLKSQIRKFKREERSAKLRNKNEKYGIWDFLLDLILNS